MTLLSDIESATEGSAELGAQALNALSKTESYFGGLYEVRRQITVTTSLRAKDISSDLTELWAECERRGYPHIHLEYRATEHRCYLAWIPAPNGSIGGNSANSPCLALLAALLRAQGVGDE